MGNIHNPYAPSAATLGSKDRLDTHLLWRNGKVLVLSRQGDLPDRCVKCNEPAEAPTKTRKLYWHHPGFYAFLLINIFLYAIVAAFARKRVDVSPGLCNAHKRKRTRGIIIGWSGFILGFMAFVATISHDQPLLALLILCAFFATTIIGMLMSRIVYAKRIDDRYILLKGCGEEFLAAIPEYRPGTRDW